MGGASCEAVRAARFVFSFGKKKKKKKNKRKSKMLESFPLAGAHQMRRCRKWGFVSASVVEWIEVASHHDRPGSRAERADGVREPAPRDEEALVGVHVRAIREAQASRPQLRRLEEHRLRISEERVSLLRVTLIAVELRHHLAHVDRTERPLS